MPEQGYRTAPPAASGSGVPPAVREAGLEAGFVLAFLFLDWVSYFDPYGPVGFTPWDPAKGLAFAWLIWRGPWRGLLLFGAMLLAAGARGSPGSWLLLATGSALVAALYTLAAALLTRRLGFDARLERARDVILLLVAGAAGAALVAVLTSGLVVAGGILTREDFAPAALRQWVGDLIGIAVFTPAVLRAPHWRGLGRAVPAGRHYVEAFLAAAVIAGVLWIVFGAERADEYKLFYLLFLPLLAVAVIRGIDGACVAALITQLGLLVIVYNQEFSPFEVTDFQILLVALTVTALLTGAVVTERGRAERAMRESERLLRERQGELEHSARLGALGEMASAMAHELNQPMTASRAYIRTAQRVLSAEGSGEEGRARAANAIASAVAQIDLAAGILRNLRELVRPRVVAAQPTDMGEIVDQSLALLRAQVRGARAEVTVRRAPGLKPAMAERIRVQQVILNLLRNALDTVKPMPPRRRLVEVDIRPAVDGRFVEIAVRDHGPGVSTEMTEKLFTAFATTKPEGLGLGLSICRGIVHEHGGTLRLESTGPEGADFRFTLPVAEPKIER
jgi:signal transduction histidine kinase